jgi:hypothetical protein
MEDNFLYVAPLITIQETRLGVWFLLIFQNLFFGSLKRK